MDRLPEVEVWDYETQCFIPHIKCPGEKRVRVDYHGDLNNLDVFAVAREETGEFWVLEPYRPLKDWLIHYS